MNYDNVRNAVEKIFTSKRVLVIGDIMVDRYVVGKVSRISPEAPVPILNYVSENRKAGGASNVAMNLVAMGAAVGLIGVAANDDEGNWIRNEFKSHGIDVTGVFEEAGRITSVKTRFATKAQQLLRMDNENADPIREETKKEILNYIKGVLPQFDGVVISDYCKGLLADEFFVSEIIQLCNQNGVFVSIDSKSKNIQAFKDADFVKPNNLELEAAVSIKIKDENTLDLAGEKYLKNSGAKGLLVTRGADGISVFVPGHSRQDYPTEAVQVFDVTGAGDTVISSATLARISGLEMDDAIRLANMAAGIAISKVGTVAVSNSELLEILQ